MNLQNTAFLFRHFLYHSLHFYSCYITTDVVGFGQYTADVTCLSRLVLCDVFWYVKQQSY